MVIVLLSKNPVQRNLQVCFMHIMISSVKITEIQRFYIMLVIHAKMNKKVLTFALLTGWRVKKRAQQCLPRFLWRGRHFDTCGSLGSSLVKMPQAFHDSSICFDFLYFHRNVNTFKTPEMCLCLGSDI